jgi:hypothetical protein
VGCEDRMIGPMQKGLAQYPASYPSTVYTASATSPLIGGRSFTRRTFH